MLEQQRIGFRKYQLNLELEDVEEQLKRKRMPILTYVDSINEISHTKKGVANLFFIFFFSGFYQMDTKLSHFFCGLSTISIIAYLYQVEKKKTQNDSLITQEELEQRRQNLMKEKEDLTSALQTIHLENLNRSKTMKK